MVFTPFNFDITDKVKEGDNFVVVRVNNDPEEEGVPTVNTDWWNYGGITRDVLLVETPEVSIDDYLVQLSKEKYNQIEGYAQLNEAVEGEQVTISIPELKISKEFTTDAEGKAKFSFKAKPELWSDVNPKLYNVTLALGDEVLEDKIGFRHIETEGKSILLNGEKVFLRGICIHEEAPFRQGRVANKAECRTLLEWAKDLGCNFVRLAHYPHSEDMIRLADEMGLMVWSEIPVYWTIHWDNPKTYANASAQLHDMIERDKNRSSVVIWSVANETPRGEARDKFLINLIDQARDMDPTRLVSMAMERTHGDNVSIIDDNMSQYVDVISFNNYVGWYFGKAEDCDDEQWIIKADKPVIVSEFGGGALQGFHGDEDERWTEEFLDKLYRHTLPMYNKIDGFSGCAPWLLVDFRSPRRQNQGIQDFYNRKGLISEQGIYKKPFYTVQKFYKEKAEEYNK